MSRKLPITGEYPPAWPAINAKVCEDNGHRCIRCFHPYKKGTHGKGEWSPCDHWCNHAGPFGMLKDGVISAINHPRFAKAECRQLYAQWRILTVHHFDGNKSNCEWWNLLPLCQRCHLQIQTRVNPHQPYMFEHSEWLKPFVAGFYAHKYEGKNLSRREVMDDLLRLLELERLA